MPTNKDEKTASAPKKFRLNFWVATVAVFLAALVGTVLVSVAAVKSPADCSERYRDDISVKLRGVTFESQVADTDASREKGLSGKNCLPGNKAMLFDFDKPGSYCIWMKDMKFPIDIVWLDDQKSVIKASRSVAPDTYPTSFCPDTKARYVLELTEGTVRRLEITVGDAANF